MSPAIVINDTLEDLQPHIVPGSPLASCALDSDETVVADIIAGDQHADNDLPPDTDTRAEGANAETIWELPVCVSVPNFVAIFHVSTD